MGDVSSGMARFEIRGELARGGRGIIYWAWDHVHGIDVAVKIIRDLKDEAAISRFQADAELLASLSHPGIAPVLDYGVAETAESKQAYLVTPLLVGASLAQSLARDFSPLPHVQVISAASQAADALEAAHKRGLFHRALKPSNIFVETSGTARLIDFGCGLDESFAGTATLHLLPYLAPELLMRRPATAASDIYALAATCYYSLTKHHAMSGDSEAVVYKAVLETPAKPLHHHVPGIPAGLNDVILQALSKDPARRFASAADFASALRGSVARKRRSVVLTAIEPEPAAPVAATSSPRPVTRRDQDIELLRKFRDRSLGPDIDRHRDRLRKATIETAALYPDDPQIQSLADSILQNVEDSLPVHVLVQKPAKGRWEDFRAKLKSLAAGRNTERYMLFGAAGLILVAAAATFLRPSSGATSNLVPLEVITDPDGARVAIDGQPRGRSSLDLDLPVGSHLATASLDGFGIARARFDLAGGVSSQVALKLLPARPTLRIESEMEGGSASLAGKPFNRIGSTSFIHEDMREGPSVLNFTVRSSSVDVPLFLAERQPPRLSGEFSSREILLVVATTYGQRLHIDCNLIGASVSIDDGKPSPLSVGGASFDNLEFGPHRVTIDDGSMRRVFPVRVTGDPVMRFFALARPEDDRGAIILSSGLDDATVILNGAKTSRRTQGGLAYIGGLAPGAYSVSVAKEGYEPAAAVKVQVAAGAESKIQIGLKAIPKPALLQLSALPGTEVLVDGHYAGETNEDGSFRGAVNPGSRRITLRRGSSTSTPLGYIFRAGETFQPGANDLQFAQRNGSLELYPEPSDARLLLRPYGQPDTAARMLLKNSTSLPEGNYVLQASAPNFGLLAVNFSVLANETTRVPVRLKPLPASMQPSALGMESFEEPDRWLSDGTWMVRRGGGFVTYSPTAQAGMYSFSIQPRRNQRLQWFANFTGPKDYCVFRLDRRQFSRQRFENGRPVETVTRAVPSDPGYPGWFDVRLDVESTRVTTQLKVDGKWITVDEWVNEKKPFAQGQFGFLIPDGAKPNSGEEYAVRDLRFTPAR